MARTQTATTMTIEDVDRGRLGECFVEVGFVVQAGRPTVRAPDLALIAGDRGRAASDHPGFVEGAPELAVEVVSPSDTTGEVHAKALMWLEAGSRIQRPPKPTTTYRMNH